VVDRVFLHIGLPKTATSYLQTIIWSNRSRLRRAGVVVPGSNRTDHLWASREVRDDPHQQRAPQRHRTAWTRLQSELASSSGTGLISHEFFAAASGRQARDLVTALGDAEVHVVVTAREPLGLFTASWQESLKNGSTTPMADYGHEVSRSSTAIWNWRTLDLRLVLQRWSQAVPPERIHVLVLDPTADRDDIWRRFAGLLGVDPDAFDLSQSFPNTSMGVAEAETLRRINMRLEGFNRAFDKGVYIRTFLADERLVPRKGEKFWPEPDQVADCRRRARSAVSYLKAGDFDVSGRVENLLVPDEVEHRRQPASVTDAEVAEVAVGLAATMLGDVRALRTDRRQQPPGRRGRYAARGRRAWRRLRAGLRPKS
jgi:hypothetical protein